MATKFHEFCDKLAFLQRDQPSFERQAGQGDLEGPKHEELVVLGSKMLKNLLILAKKGDSFASGLPPDFLERLTVAVHEYYTLFRPPKLFGGYFPCLNLVRKGPEYQKRLSIVKAHVVSAVFLPVGIMVDARAEKLNYESVKYTEYVVRMNDLFKLLAGIATKGGEAVREKAKQNLYSATSDVAKFIDYYCDQPDDPFPIEAKRRLRQVREILDQKRPKEQPALISSDTQQAPPPKYILGRASLVKAQSSLQEIMNSAAVSSLGISKNYLYACEDIQKLLKKERDIEVAHFNSLEDEMPDDASIQILHRLREESEIVYNDANNKLRDAAKRWNTVKSQSSPRPVAVLEEPPPPPQPSATSEINNIRKKATSEGSKMAKEAVSGVKDIVNLVAGDVVKGVGTGVSGAMTIATTGSKTALNAGKKAVQLPTKAAKELLSSFDDSQSPSPSPSSKNSSSFSSFAKLPNLLD